MPNWKELVGQRLSDNAFLDDETVAELATHLEEEYQRALSCGQDEESATEIALQEVEDWRVLARKIRRLKGGRVNHRTKSLWVPSLVTLLGASAALALVEYMRIGPLLVWVGSWAITLYWVWLAILPAFGALGAYLSQRSESMPKVRLVAALAPAIAMLVVMSLILPWGLLIDGFRFFRLVGFGLGLINWVIVPGIALLAGAAPFLKRSKRQETSRC